RSKGPGPGRSRRDHRAAAAARNAGQGLAQRPSAGRGSDAGATSAAEQRPRAARHADGTVMTELWVDPEGVSHIGRNYGEQAALFRSYLRQLADLRARYGNSWGNDDLGQKFSAKFLEGMDTLERIIGTVADTLEYTGNGLKLTGKSFRAANDQAADASHQLDK